VTILKKQLSFEIFPPKKELSAESALRVADELAQLSPDFISVTYGAGGSTAKNTLEVASYIQNEKKTPVLAHLTCLGAPLAEIDSLLTRMRASGISKVLALRGDKPSSGECYRDFTFAADLVRYIKSRGGFSVGAACYPEGHPESPDKERDILYLKEKCEAGAEFLITQFFFDNRLFEAFLEKARAAGITAPVLAGIMPVTHASQITKMAALSCATIPADLQKLLYRYQDDPDSLTAAGVHYAVNQCAALTGHDGLHLYTMNKPSVAKAIVSEL
jgi:methylenetetrahydrofolate reductase (NADPH)